MFMSVKKYYLIYYFYAFLLSVANVIFANNTTAGFELKLLYTGFFKTKFDLFVEYPCDCGCHHNWWKCDLYSGIDNEHKYFDICFKGEEKILFFYISKRCSYCEKYCKRSKPVKLLVKSDEMHFLNMTESCNDFNNGNYIASLSDVGNGILNISYVNESSTNQNIRVLDFYNPICTNFVNGINSFGTLPENIETQAILNVDLPPGTMYIRPTSVGSGLIYNIPFKDWSNDDDDQDGLTYEREETLGTCDSCYDSDMDSLSDKAEIDGTNVSVQVFGKSLLNRFCKTNPAYYDTDRDGRSDGEEISGFSSIVTDPLNPDSDGDGVPDGFDPQPLVPFVIESNSMPSGWVNYWSNLGECAGLSANIIANLVLPNADCDGDGICNSAELSAGTPPLFGSSFCKAVFSEITKHPISNCWNFSLSLYADHYVTGAVLLSKSNWSKGLLRGRNNFGVRDLASKFPDCLVAPFIASPGLSNNFSFFIDEHWFRGLITNSEILRVYTVDYGILGDIKNISLSGVAQPPGGFMSPPNLSLPFDNEVYRARTNIVFFSWTSSALNNVCALSIADNDELYTVDIEITCAQTNAFKIFAPGDYYWNVSGINESGRMFRSETRRFRVIWPDKDTDGDGYFDAFEFDHGSDWNDPNSLPVTTNCAVEISSPAECLTSYELKAKNGFPPYKWNLASGTLPPGLNIRDGQLQGTPKFEGVWRFKLRVTDSSDSFDTVDAVYTVTPKRNNIDQKFGRGKFVPSSAND